MPVLFDIEYIGKNVDAILKASSCIESVVLLSALTNPIAPPLHINVANERSAGERETRWLE
jgi:hypothetical protein